MEEHERGMERRNEEGLRKRSETWRDVRKGQTLETPEVDESQGGCGGV